MDFFEKVFLTILNMSITASYAAIAVIIARLFLKRAPKVFSYSLWSIVLFRLICPFSFSSAFSLFGLIVSGQSFMSPTQYIPLNIGLMASPAVNTGIDSINAIVNTSLPSGTPYASVNPLQIWIILGSYVWLLGILALLFYSVITYYRLRQKISMATLVADNIYESDLITTPFVCGYFRPKIYLPLCISGQEREYVLRHEQTHIKRLDYLVKPLAFFTLVLHWFNPLLWLCFSLMTKDMEMSCDEKVIENSVKEEDISNYSYSLLALATNKKMPAPSPLAFGESNVKSRIKNLLKYKKPTFWVISALIIVVIILGYTLLSNPVQQGIAGNKDETGYDIDFLMKNKTPYIGNNSKVVALIDALPLPLGIARDTVRLHTSNTPYGATINYNLNDDSIVVSEEQFLRNSLLLFALIDNADEVTHLGHWNDKLLSSTPFRYTYNRADAERVVGGDIRNFAENREKLAELIQIVQMIKADNKKTAFKGLELYVWRNPELTGNDDIYYTLLLGTNRNKTEDEVYDLSVATTNIEDINREIGSYEEVAVFVNHPRSISKEEMSKIADQIIVKRGTVAVGTGWFDKN